MADTSGFGAGERSPGLSEQDERLVNRDPDAPKERDADRGPHHRRNLEPSRVQHDSSEPERKPDPHEKRPIGEAARKLGLGDGLLTAGRGVDQALPRAADP